MASSIGITGLLYYRLNGVFATLIPLTTVLYSIILIHVMLDIGSEIRILICFY